MPRTGVVLILALLGLSLSGRAQREAAQPVAPPVHVVHIDAVASDGRGRPVTDLIAADFEVREDGEPRAIEGLLAPSGASGVFAVFIDEFHLTAGASTD